MTALEIIMLVFGLVLLSIPILLIVVYVAIKLGVVAFYRGKHIAEQMEDDDD